MELIEVLQRVNDRNSFVEFVVALIEDKKHFGQHWENSAIEDYLDAAKSWIVESQRDDIFGN